MLYGDLQYAKAAFKRGDNVTAVLRGQFGANSNSSEIIEISYDLQAGSYVDYVKQNRNYWQAYTSEISNILRLHCTPEDSILDVGTGEMTTLAGVANNCYSSVADYYACDISWSRLIKGKEFLAEELSESVASKINPFVADLFRLPFVDGAIDVVWTSHALEPNGGKEREAIAELLRVVRKKLVLFEPYYEKNSPEGKKRMEHLGYIKGLLTIIKECGASCDEVIPIENISNPLNPTHAFVISPPRKLFDERKDSPWACPATQFPMARIGDCFWSQNSMLAYPVLQGIPILRPESAILASVLEENR